MASRPEFLPRGLSVSETISSKVNPFQDGSGFTLNSTAPLATLDYGTEVAGIPFFSVSAIEPPENHHDVQIEVRYNGPYIFSVSLANGFRVETFNVSSIGSFASPLVQGGQRWQSIRLLSTGEGSPASISFDRVGFQATVDLYDVGDMPATFQCDDEELNAIWGLGAAAAATACVEKGTQPAVWDVDPVMGVLLRSQKPAVWDNGYALANYTMEFDASIERGGVWWTVAMPNGGYEPYLQLRLVGELPETSTFANVNKTLAPPNSILVSHGYDFVNQTTLPSNLIGTFPVSTPVAEKSWHRIKTVLAPTGHLAVSLDGQEVFQISMSDYYTGGSTVSFTGSFGVGAWQDEVAYVRNLAVTDTANGSTLYAHSLNTEDVLAQFGTQRNIESVCLDGPKRDRLVWLGDFYHTARVVGLSTSRFDLARGTLEIMLGTQNEYGVLAINTPMGYEPKTSAPLGSVGGLEDYQLLGASSMYSYIRSTDDREFLRATWPKWQKQLGWLESRINDTDGLVHLSSEFLATGATAPTSSGSCAAVQVLREFAELAEAIEDGSVASRYTTLADGLVKAVQERLWNEKLGIFSAAVNDRGNFSVPATAFCITSGVASAEQANRSIAILQSQLALGVGYKDDTNVDADDPETKISPNTNGFLLDALFRAGKYSTGHELMRSLWGAMVHNPETSSGASWEYILPDGRPGLDRFTSLAHPWGGAPTYVLTEWAAGLQPAPGPAGFGYRNWVASPEAGLAMGLKHAVGRVQTPLGPLTIRWETAEGDAELRVVVEAPVGTSGTFVLGATKRGLVGKDRYDFNVPI
ncbi:Six-hairpin glycosidase-like protein [Apiospora kogelbergensis]|uniref:Six-hairpin glycosidase-like protein n=1 Tax=Apiospora kogelbergensis TaxID=1337665 RepID=UPI0031318548